MALKTKAGQVVNRQNVNIPVINFKSLGLNETGKAYKDYFETHFIPLGQLVTQDEQVMFSINGRTTDSARLQVFKYSWCQPDNEKPAKKGEMPVSWKSVMWADTNLRKDDGDKYDDPGVALGLNLKQDAQKQAPGLHGAPEGKYPMIEPYTQTVRIPVIWKITVDDDGNIDEKSGELVWLELSFSQYNSLLETVKKFDRTQSLQAKRRKQAIDENRMMLVKYVKDPKAKIAERNTVEVVLPFEPDEWSNKFSEIAEDQYPKMLEALEKRYTMYQNIIDSLNAGELSVEEATELAHASVAEKLLVAWGEIDADSGLSPESINQLFETLIPQYSVSMETSIPRSAIKRSVTVDLSEPANDQDDDEIPF